MKQFYSIKNRHINKSVSQQNLIAFGNSQMNILENQMRLQKITQGIRKVSLPGGGFLVCRKCFNLKIVDVYYPDTSLTEVENIISQEISYLALIFGYEEEQITFQYTDNNQFLFSSDGEDVFCIDGGFGFYSYIIQDKLYGQFTKCFSGIITGETTKATAEVTECLENVYVRSYEVKEITQKDIIDSITEKNTVSAYDVYPLTNVSCAGDLSIENTWSKTYDDMIVTAFAYYLPSIQSYVWQVSVSYKDQILTWGKNGDTVSAIFSRRTCIGEACLTTRRSHVGFDVWAIVNDDGVKEYYVGVIGEQEATLHQWKYVAENSYLENDWSISLDKISPDASLFTQEIYTTPIERSILSRTLRLVGYGFDEEEQKHLVYWAPFTYSKYYAEDKISLSSVMQTNYYSKTDSNGNDMGIVNGMWNPITKKPFFVWDSIFESAGSDINYASGLQLISNAILQGISSSPCPECSNGTTSISDTFLGQVVDMTMYTIIRPNNSFTYVANSYTLATVGQSYDRGKTIFDVSSLSKGSRLEVTDFKVSFTSRWPIGAEEEVNTIASKNTESSGCRPSSMADYSFVAGIFGPDSFRYKYLKTSYVEQEESSTSHSCVPGYTNEILAGSELNLDSSLSITFPYDDTWKAILLHGYARSATNESTAEKEVKNFIIYKNQIDANLFLLDPYGNKTNFDSNISRAFFKQQNVIVTQGT